MIRKLLIFSSLLFIPAGLCAQVAPAAKGGPHKLTAGAEYSSWTPDYDNVQKLQGFTIFADYDIVRRFSLEGEARFLGVLVSEDGNETQKDYLAGPRYRFATYHGLSGYAKLVAGGVWIRFPSGIGSGSYFAYAPGGTAEYEFHHRWIARADYEYQFVPSAPNIPGQPNRGLTPHGFSVGIGYRIF